MYVNTNQVISLAVVGLTLYLLPFINVFYSNFAILFSVSFTVNLGYCFVEALYRVKKVWWEVLSCVMLMHIILKT